MNPLMRLEKEYRYPYLSPSELLARLEEKAILYLPIGSLEWHNEHLPLGTDTFHAIEICMRLCAELSGVVLPPFWWNTGGWPHHSTYLMPQTLYRATLKNVCIGLRPIPATLLVLVNGHGSRYQEASIVAVAEELNCSDFPMRVIVAGPCVLGAASSCRLDHADAGETSFALEMIPQLTRMERPLDPDLLSGEQPFAQSQPNKEGGRELWLAYFADAKALIEDEYSRLKPAAPVSADELRQQAWGLLAQMAANPDKNTDTTASS